MMDKKSHDVIHSFKPLSEFVSLEKIEPGLKKYKIFTKAMLKDILYHPRKRNLYDELCTRGPNAFVNFIRILEEAGYHGFAETLQERVKRDEFPKCYEMSSDPLGYCLIIINKNFDDLDIRNGCEADVKALKNLFENILNFKVEEIKEDKTGQEIEDILKEFSQKSEFEQAHCCIVYILSHGGETLNLDFIYGTDSEKVFKRNIYTLFDNKNCKLLIGKPKIFFFQACRGELLDAAKTASSEKSNANNSVSSAKDSTDDINSSSGGSSAKEQTYSILSEVFIVHSCLPGHKSWKDDEKGSWLCQDLVSVVSEYYDKCHFADMMTIVNHKQQCRISEDGYKQVLHFEQKGVTGLLYFDGRKKVSV